MKRAGFDHAAFAVFATFGSGGSGALWAAVLSFAGVAIAGAGRVDAKPRPRVLIFTYQPMADRLPEDLGAQTTAVVANEVTQNRITVIRADDLGQQRSGASPDQPTGDPKAGPRAQRLMDHAEEALDDAAFDVAAQRLAKAIALLENHGDAVADLRLLAEAYLQAGIAYFRHGEPDLADDMLNKAAHYDPDRVLVPAEFPPIFISVYDRARYNVLRRPRARLEVNAPRGAQVLFDGRPMGTAPLVLTDTLPGKHWIRIEQTGRPAQVKTLKVRSRKTLVVEFGAQDSAHEQGLRGAMRRNALTFADVNRIRTAGKKARATYALVGGFYQTSTAYRIRSLVIEVATGRVGRLVGMDFDLDMLTAEIEVFKLAKDIRNQFGSAGLTQPVEADPSIVVAPEYQGRSPRRASKASLAMTTVRAAPRPTQRPGSIYATRMPTTPDRQPPPPPRRSTETALIPNDEIDPSPLTGGQLVQADEAAEEEGDLLWLWISLGIVAAAAAGTGVYFLASDGSPDEGTLNIQW